MDWDWLTNRRLAIKKTKIKLGLLPKPREPQFQCAVCGRFAKLLEMHHSYYENQWWATWDCSKCGRCSD